MASSEALEKNPHIEPELLKAPDGTYRHLVRLPHGRLGTQHTTKHTLSVRLGIFTPSLRVYLRASDGVKGLPENEYRFNIDRSDSVLVFEAARRERYDVPAELIPLSDDVFDGAVAALDHALRLAERRAREARAPKLSESDQEGQLLFRENPQSSVTGGDIHE